MAPFDSLLLLKYLRLLCFNNDLLSNPENGINNEVSDRQKSFHFVSPFALVLLPFDY